MIPLSHTRKAIKRYNDEVLSIKVIQLNPSEWRQYYQLRMEALETNPSAFGSSYASNVDQPPEEWQNRLADAAKGENQWFVFASSNNKLIGMMGAYRPDPNIPAAHITAAFVKPQFRNQGIGKQMLTNLMDRIAQNPSIKKFELEVNSEQPSAVHLYESLGFHKTKESIMTLGDGKEHLCFAMEKSL